MEIRPIKTESDYEKELALIAALMGAKLNSPEGDELDVLSTLVDVYESRHFPIEPADPVDAILFRMEQEGLDRKALEPYLEPSACVGDTEPATRIVRGHDSALARRTEDSARESHRTRSVTSRPVDLH